MLIIKVFTKKSNCYFLEVRNKQTRNMKWDRYESHFSATERILKATTSAILMLGLIVLVYRDKFIHFYSFYMLYLILIKTYLSVLFLIKKTNLNWYIIQKYNGLKKLKILLSISSWQVQTHTYSPRKADSNSEVFNLLCLSCQIS